MPPEIALIAAVTVERLMKLDGIGPELNFVFIATINAVVDADTPLNPDAIEAVDNDATDAPRVVVAAAMANEDAAPETVTVIASLNTTQLPPAS